MVSVQSLTRKLVGGLALALLLLPAATSAHTYRADGPIRVLLHTDPDDNPATHEQAQLNFYVFDDENKFLGSHCVCRVTVSGNGKTILKQAVFTDKDANKNNASVPVIFPQLGVYTVALTGKPKPGTDFHAFNLDYIVRVAQEGQGSGSTVGTSSLLANAAKLVAIYGFAAVIIVAIIVVSAKLDRKRRTVSAPTHKPKRRQR